MNKDFILETFKLIEKVLSEKLEPQGFIFSESEYHEEHFDSIYRVWKNEDELLALRLVWDGKESWFAVEESPFFKGKSPKSWADLYIAPLNEKNSNSLFQKQVVEEVLNEII